MIDAEDIEESGLTVHNLNDLVENNSKIAVPALAKLISSAREEYAQSLFSRGKIVEKDTDTDSGSGISQH